MASPGEHLQVCLWRGTLVEDLKVGTPSLCVSGGGSPGESLLRSPLLTSLGSRQQLPLSQACRLTLLSLLLPARVV